jgi:hypothetical protein
MSQKKKLLVAEPTNLAFTNDNKNVEEDGEEVDSEEADVEELEGGGAEEEEVAS